MASGISDAGVFTILRAGVLPSRLRSTRRRPRSIGITTVQSPCRWPRAVQRVHVFGFPAPYSHPLDSMRGDFSRCLAPPACQSALRPADSSGSSAKAERSLLSGAFSLSLAAPPTGTSQATRDVWVLLERNPPNRPFAPVGSPASGRESNPAPSNKERN